MGGGGAQWAGGTKIGAPGSGLGGLPLGSEVATEPGEMSRVSQQRAIPP